MLTEKDIKKIAEILSNYYLNFAGDIEEEQRVLNNVIWEISTNFIDWFKSENPKFDEHKFRGAVLKE